MNDHNLDDLIIDNIAPKNNKTKSLLTIVALLIVILIVAIILTKTLLKSPENDTLSFEENLSEMIAPELKLQKETKEEEVEKPQAELSLSTIIKEKTTTSKFTEEKKTLKVTKEKDDFNTSKIMKPTVDKMVKPQVIINKPTKKPTISKSSPKTTLSETYYVQVGSFRENPSPHFLSIIRNSGFTYHVTTPDRSGYKKLLIGPYKTRTDVDKARNIIRQRIHKSAFVVQK